jgi:hypothetical protein
MLWSEHSHLDAMHLLLGLLVLPQAIEAAGQVASSRKRVRMLRSEHTHTHGVHLAVDLLALGVFPLIA